MKKKHFQSKKLQSFIALCVLATVIWIIPFFIDHTQPAPDRLWYMPGGLLTNTSWDIYEVRGAGAHYSIVVPGKTPKPQFSLSFEKDKLTGTMCNIFSGPYTFNGMAVRAEPITSTKRACINGGLMEAEQALFTALSSGSQYAIIGNKLEIIDVKNDIHIVMMKKQGEDKR